MNTSTKTPKTRLKIGFVIDDSIDRTQNGVQQYVLTLGTWLRSQGHTVHYLTSGAASNEHVHNLGRNIGVRFNKNRMTIPLPAKRALIKRLLAQEKYDVLHVQMPYSPLMAGRVIMAAPATTAVVGTFHILPYGRLQQAGSKALYLAQKRSLQHFDAICSVSAVAAAFAKSHFAIDSTVIPNMVTLPSTELLEKTVPGRIVYLGRLVSRKGCQELLRAINTLPHATKARMELIIASDGPLRPQLEKYVAAHHIPNVRFVGFVSDAEKVRLLSTAQLAVFPSLGGESFGIVLIEAMAAGAGVVIGGDNPGYRSVLGEWPEVLVDPKDTATFAKTLGQLLDDQKLAAQLHESQQRALSQYDVAVAGKRIEYMYRRVVAKIT